MELIYHLELLLTLTIGTMLSASVLPRISLVSFRRRLFDSVDSRKLHTGYIPRLGGIAFFPCIIVSALLAIVCYNLHTDVNLLNTQLTTRLLTVVCCLFILYLMGMMDDLIGVRYRSKFVIQIICGILLVSSNFYFDNLYGLFGIYEIPRIVGIPFTIFIIVYILNAINLIDGIDGLASGLSLIAFAAFGCMFVRLQWWMDAFIAFSAFGVLIPFFYYNVFGNRGRKIFMGDTGSLTIGLLLSMMTIQLSKSNPIKEDIFPGAIVIAFSFLIVPMLDVVRVVMRRLRTGHSPFLPDKNHIHHKFVALGMSQRRAMIYIISIAATFALLNVILIHVLPATLLFLIDVVVWSVMHVYITMAINRKKALQESDLYTIHKTESKTEINKKPKRVKKKRKMKHHLFLLSLFLLLLLLSSCNTSKKILYFQDVVVNHPEVIEATKDITVQPMDQISIMVSSKDPQLAALFNLTRIQVRAGSDLQGSNNNGEVSGYTLDDSGNIDFPVLGTLHIAGMTKNEIAALVKKRLIEENLVKDPVVTVEFMNLNFSVLGEVTNPGKYSISKDQITLLEALSMAGDLTIYGQRDGIYVIREENGQRTTYLTDIRSKDFFRSPVYYLKQNDVVYVQPNKVRAGQSTINDNNVKSVSLWLSIGSFLTTLAILIFN